MISGWTQQDLFEEAYIAARTAFVPQPDTVIIDRPDWFQLTTPSLRDGGLNEVALAVLDEATADRVIDETIAHYRSQGIRWRWTVGPDSRPADLATRLIAKGLEARTIQVMVCSVPETPWPIPEGASIRHVGFEDLDAFVEVMAAGWNMNPGPLREFHHRLIVDHGERFSRFVALDGDRAVGAASAVRMPRSLFFQGAVVLPSHRGRGLYRAMIEARAAVARAAKLPLLALHARAETSAPIVAGLGFETLLSYASLSEP